MLYQALRPLDHHLRHTLVVLRQFIKRRVDDFNIVSLDGLLDVRYLLRTLVDQQDQQMDLRIIPPYGQRHLLKQGCLTSFRRRHDHTALPLPDRRQEIYDPHGSARLAALKPESLIREDRRHILEIGPPHRLHRIDIVDSR